MDYMYQTRQEVQPDVTILPVMPGKESTKAEKARALHEELITQLLTLVTSGFGVVAALAWNDAIQSFVKEYVESKIPGSGLAYRFLYALIITAVIVLTTYYLSKIASKFRAEKDK